MEGSADFQQSYSASCFLRAYSHISRKKQENAKRALEVAAAGGHNILLVGAPGSGKSMLAKRLPSILPPLSLGESLETTKIHSVAGKLGQEGGLISKRPFRDPHHTISTVAMTVQPECTRSITATSGRPENHHFPRKMQCGISRQLYARSIHESLSLRILQSSHQSLCV